MSDDAKCRMALALIRPTAPLGGAYAYPTCNIRLMALALIRPTTPLGDAYAYPTYSTRLMALTLI
ncbi:hypothetical protein [Dryocola sp. BD613]|uniref:hypothetical protein n=1 Tax=Dryocola sp. BD613 TaxID=3133272 RepID=UPI003F509A93